MAMLKDTLVATTPIASPAEEFFDFMKNNLSEIVNIYPAAFKSAQLIEGVEGTVGAVTIWIYVVGGVELTQTLRTEAIDDEANSIVFNVLAGDLLQVYTSFVYTLTVSAGSATWSFDYEKASILSPPPELYVPVGITLNTLVDAYLLTQ